MGVERRVRESAAARYRPRRPSQSVLYRCVQEHLETWLAQIRDGHDDEWSVPGRVEREFRRYLDCGIPTISSCFVSVIYGRSQGSAVCRFRPICAKSVRIGRAFRRRFVCIESRLHSRHRSAPGGSVAVRLVDGLPYDLPVTSA